MSSRQPPNPEIIESPGFQRPELPDGTHPGIANAFRNVFDNIHYLRQRDSLVLQQSKNSPKSSSTPTFIVSTHVLRTTQYAAQGQVVGTGYLEADRRAIYVITYGPPKAWIWVGGIMFGLDANKPSDLGANDQGFLYYATDIPALKIWNGSAWALV